MNKWKWHLKLRQADGMFGATCKTNKTYMPLIALLFVCPQRTTSWRMWTSVSSLCRRKMLMGWIALPGRFEAELLESSMWSHVKWTIMNLESTQRKCWRPPSCSLTKVPYKYIIIQLEICFYQTDLCIYVTWTHQEYYCSFVIYCTMFVC